MPFSRVWFERAELGRPSPEELALHFRAAFANAPTGMAIAALDGRWLHVNRALCEMVGYSEEELLQGRFQDVTPEEDQEIDERECQPLIEGRTDRVRYEKHYRHHDGHLVPVQLTLCLALDEALGWIYIGQIEDVSERRRTEEALREREQQLRQAHKMEAIGRLAGGVAHDFNNILTAINGCTDLLLHGMAEADELREEVLEIRRAAQRAAQLTGQLLAYSRPRAAEPGVLHVAEVVRGVEGMLRRVIGEHIELRLAFAGCEGTRVRADRGQLEQVLINLVMNARDAMEGGGVLTIECRTATCAAPPRRAGEVRLRVRDTGSGILPEHLPHIFEPFFTTKQERRGTGLGLATVYEILRRWGGEVVVESTPGAGSSFEIRLPVVMDPVTAAEPPRVEALAPPLGETVLLVEDEPAVRALAARVLRRAGYRVLESASGAAALAAHGPSADAIDLLISDVVMPGMSGPDLAARLRALRPGMKVLFMSGYGDGHWAPGAEGPLLAKPFSPGELTGAVQRALGEGALVA